MASSERRRAAVTGAGGYVGSRICDFLRREQFEVLELRHHLPRDAGPAGQFQRRYSLLEEVDPALLRGTELLVHCAYDFSPARGSEIRRVNLDGSRRLFDAARHAGVQRLVFISTMSSFEGCRSNYGRVKLAIEREAREQGAVVIRPGLVFGRVSGGMVGSLQRVVSLSPVLPMIGSGRQKLYLVHEEDLARIVLECALRGAELLPRPVVAAREQPLTFGCILRALGERAGRRLLLVPVPWRLVWAGLAAAELVGLKVGLRSDSVLSLVHQDPRPDFMMTRELGVECRPFHEAGVSRG